MNLIKCPKCKRPVSIQTEFPLGNLINQVMTCGHSQIMSRVIVESASHFDGSESGNVINLQSQNGNTLNCNAIQRDIEFYGTNPNLDAWFNHIGVYDEFKPYEIPIHESFYSVDKSECSYDYQIDGIKFAESSQLECLIGDAQGLGKTIQGINALKRNKAVALPCLIIGKGSLIFQWAHELMKWYDDNPFTIMPIIKREHMISGFEIYIISRDMLGREGVLDKLLKLNLKTVIIDEVQGFKDPNASRTEALLNLINLGQIKYKIALSGTPIKNRFKEYKTVLVDIIHALNEAQFEACLGYDEKGFKTKLNPLMVEKFKEWTSHKVLRREKHEVLTNLPDLTRDYQIITIDDPNVKNSYNSTIGLFKSWLNDNKNNKTGITSTALLGWLAQLRAITGAAKCKNAIEWSRDFLESTDEALSIGIHHQSVRDTLHFIFEQNGLRPLKFSGEDNSYVKSDVIRRFTSGANRLLVINMIAGGEGLNLQNCANALVLERCWNSADEEQFESRFHRNGQIKAVTITYMIAKGTIDEFFHEMVQTKRRNLHQAGIGLDANEGDNLSSLLEFAELVANARI